MISEFPPEYRLKSKSDFNALRGGGRVHVDGLRFVYCQSIYPHARLGLAVSRKYGNAVKRNRLKRKIREAFRQHQIRDLPLDILVFPSAESLADTDISQQAINGLNRITKAESDKKR